MGNTISINDGLKVYDIVNQDGEFVGQFKINPADAGMVERYKKGIKNLEESLKKYSGMEDSMNSFIEMQDLVVKELEHIVGNDSVSVFFEVMGAFSPQGEQLYYEKVLDIIVGIIDEENKKTRQAMEKRIEKYAKKYQ